VRPGDPEVADLGDVALAHQHVAGLDVTVHDAEPVRRRQCCGDLLADVRDASGAQRSLGRDQVGEGL
jgi:hypothetical protein